MTDDQGGSTHRATYFCAQCGETFGAAVVHCPNCDHHYPHADGECGNCHREWSDEMEAAQLVDDVE